MLNFLEVAGKVMFGCLAAILVALTIATLVLVFCEVKEQIKDRRSKNGGQ